MSYIEVIISGIVLGLAIAVSVGPTLFAVIRFSTNHSYKAGIAFVLGVSFSDILYVTLANIASSWLDFLNDHRNQMAIGGAIVFISFGLYALIKKYKPTRPKPASEVQISKRDYFKLWTSGFLMNALNPGAIILWITAAIHVSDYTLLGRITFFAVCLGIVLSGDISKVILADKIRKWLTPRKSIYLNRISGACILLFGLGLLLKVFFKPF